MVRLGRPDGERPPSPPARPVHPSLVLSLLLHGLIALPLLAAGSTGSASTEAPALLVDVAMVSSASAANADADAHAEASDSTSPAEPAAQAASRPEIPLPPPEDPPPIDTSTLAIERQTPPIEQETRTTEGETKPVERETRIDLTPPEEPPPLDTATLKAEREIKIDLAPADEPPPLDTSTLKSVEPPKPAEPARQAEPPKPRPAPKPAPPAQAAKTETPRPPARAAAPSGAPAASFGSANDARQAAAGFLPAPAIVWEGKPRFRHPPTPAAYPPRAIELNEQGEVLVRVRLDTAGAAVEIVLHRSSGYGSLDRAALAAVRSWHFLPAMRDGRPVPSWVEIPVRFRLR